MSYTGGSISKGVFVHKGKKKRAQTADYLCNADDHDSTGRYDICEKIWETINDRVQILQSDLNTKIFEDLLEFVRGAYKKSDENHERRDTSLQEIPTAALVTGVNSPDHAVMFHNLHTLLKERLTPFVAELRAKDCMNIKTTVSKAVSELMGATQLIEDEGSVEDLLNMKRVTPTISVLAKWYHDKIKAKSPTKKSQSPTKRKADRSPIKQPNENTKSLVHFTEERPPVVFILEDLEAFPPYVLQDFITMCSNHLNELPVVLVFGIATSVTTVHKLLSNSASSLLCMEKFQAPPASEYLTLVIDQVVMREDIPFKLGPKVFNLLLDLFLFHDFSVLNFFKGLQFAVLDHFYNHSYSIICDDLSRATQAVSKLSEKQLKVFQELPSYIAYIEKEDQKTSPIKNSKDIKKVLLSMVKTIHDYHSAYFPVLRCLHTCAAKIPRYPLGKQVRELYARSISSPICDTSEYQECMLLLKSLSRDELVLLLQECCNNLNCDAKEKEFIEIREKLQNYIEKFNNIEELQKKADEERKLEESKEEALPEKTNLHTLRQTLQNMEMKKKKLSVYETVRNEVFDYLDAEVFKIYLVIPSSFPLHEVFYYNDLSEIRSHIVGSPRATIQWGLGDPYHYIQHESLKTDGDNILASSPDICIAYKLHLECGRLINLYDWLQAFMTIASFDIEENRSTSKSLKKNKQDSRTIQARFIRAVSELQFLGFVKPTKRKTDHVARLTWGGC